MKSWPAVPPSPDECLRPWFVAGTISSVWPVAGGLSGGRVLRVEGYDPADVWCLKATPPTTSAPQTEAIAALIEAGASRTSWLATPRRTLATSSLVASAGDRLWQCHCWLPGKPLPPTADRAAVVAGVGAIGEVHAALAATSIRPVRPPVSRSLADRCQMLAQIADSPRPRRDELPIAMLAGKLQRQVIPPSDFQTAVADETSAFLELANLLRSGNDQVRRWSRSGLATTFRQRLLDAVASLPESERTWVLRDPHRAHLLFDGEAAKARIRGIIDYDAVGWDWPVLDMARWLSEFHAPARPTLLFESAITSPNLLPPHRLEPELVTMAVAEYRRVRPFSDQQRALLPDLIVVNALVSLENWLRWLIDEDRRFCVAVGDLRNRVERLIASLDAVC